MAVASAEMATDHCPLPEAEWGTCIPCCDNAREWWVRGTKGWHRVNADSGVCTCPGYGFRRTCSHSDRLGVVLQIQRILQQVVAPITTARRMQQASGQKVVPEISEMSQDELKAIFV